MKLKFLLLLFFLISIKAFSQSNNSLSTEQMVAIEDQLTALREKHIKFLDQGLFTEIYNNGAYWTCKSDQNYLQSKINEINGVESKWKQPNGDIARYNNLVYKAIEFAKSNCSKYNVGCSYTGKPQRDVPNEALTYLNKKREQLKQCLNNLDNTSNKNSVSKSSYSNQKSNSNNSSYSGYQPKSETQTRDEINKNVDNLTNSISSIFALSAENRKRSEERAKRVRQQEKATYNSTRNAYFENLNTIKKAKSLRKAKYTLSEEEQKLYQYILENPILDNFNYYLSSNLEYYRSEIEFFEYLFLLDKMRITDGHIAYDVVSIINGIDMGYPSIRVSKEYRNPIIRFSDEAKKNYKNIYFYLYNKHGSRLKEIKIPQIDDKKKFDNYINDLELISNVPKIYYLDLITDGCKGIWLNEKFLELDNIKTLTFNFRKYNDGWKDINFENLDKLNYIEELKFGKDVKVPINKIIKMKSIEKIVLSYKYPDKRTVLKDLKNKFKEDGIKSKIKLKNSAPPTLYINR